MSTYSNNKSNQSTRSQPIHETLSRRPRSSFEDTSFNNDTRFNTLLPEKHLRSDRNALIPTTPIPNPIHPYARTQPYYRPNCKSRAPIKSNNQSFDLQSVLGSSLVPVWNHVHHASLSQTSPVQQRTDSSYSGLLACDPNLAPVSHPCSSDCYICDLVKSNACLPANSVHAAPAASCADMFANMPKFTTTPDSVHSSVSSDINMVSDNTNLDSVAPVNSSLPKSHTIAHTQPTTSFNSINSNIKIISM